MPLFFRSINLRFLLLSFRLLTIGIFQCIVFLYCVCSPNNNVTICQMNMQIKWSYMFGKNKASWQQIALTQLQLSSVNNITNLLTFIISLGLSVVYQQSLVPLAVMCLMYVFCLYFACLMVFLWQIFFFSLNRIALVLTKCHLGDQEHFFRSGEIAPLGGGTVGGQPQPQGRRGRVTLTVVKDVICLFKLCMNMNSLV